MTESGCAEEGRSLSVSHGFLIGVYPILPLWAGLLYAPRGNQGVMIATNNVHVDNYTFFAVRSSQV